MKYKSAFFVLLSAAGYGIMPVFVRIAYNNKANIYEMLFLRFLTAILILTVYFSLTGRIKALLLPRKIMLRLIILGGILFGFTSITLYSAVYYLSPSIAELLYFSYPAFVMVFSILIYKERITKEKIISLVILLAGVFFIVNIKGVKVNVIGIVLALSCSLIYSGYVIFIKNEEIQKVDSLVIAFYVMFFANCTFFIFGLFTKSFDFKLTSQGYGAIAVIAVFSTLMAIASFAYGSKALKSSELAIIAAFEPVVTVLTDAVLLKQNISFKMVLGIALIILSVLIVSRNNKQADAITDSKNLSI